MSEPGLSGKSFDIPSSAAQHPTVVVHQHRDLLVLTQIDQEDRLIRADDRPQRLDPPVTATVPTGQPGTLGHEGPPRCAWDLKPVNPTRGTFPISTPKAFEVFLRHGLARRAPATIHHRPMAPTRSGHRLKLNTYPFPCRCSNSRMLPDRRYSVHTHAAESSTGLRHAILHQAAKGVTPRRASGPASIGTPFGQFVRSADSAVAGTLVDSNFEERRYVSA